MRADNTLVLDADLAASSLRLSQKGQEYVEPSFLDEQNTLSAYESPFDDFAEIGEALFSSFFVSLPSARSFLMLESCSLLPQPCNSAT